MATKDEHDSPVPDVGPWARVKLARLGAYLEAYMTVMAKQPWASTVYIDAFAGAGIARVRSAKVEVAEEALFDLGEDRAQDEGERGLLAGSPRVALALPRPFAHYRFVEREPERLARLRALRDEHPGRDIRVIDEDCNAWLLANVVGAPRSTWRTLRGVVFLDPFGMQVPWATIEGIARQTKLEVILNFPMYMATQRLVKRSAAFSAKERAKLDAWFGDPGWYEVAFRETPGLLGPVTTKVENASGKLVDWYAERLRALFKFVSVSPPVLNSKGGPLYHLVHCTQNEAGHRIGKHVMAMAVDGPGLFGGG